LRIGDQYHTKTEAGACAARRVDGVLRLHSGNHDFADAAECSYSTGREPVPPRDIVVLESMV